MTNAGPSTSSGQGLTQAEAEKRLREFGYNELKEKEVNPWLQFLSYYWGPIPWMIEAAALLSAVVTNYATYRIAETIRVLLFMTLSILVFNFYPVTAVMIVLLALLNDGAILSIAYDRIEGSDRPERWNMPVVLGIATLLGIFGVFASFGLLYFAEKLAPSLWHVTVSRDVSQAALSPRRRRSAVSA